MKESLGNLCRNFKLPNKPLKLLEIINEPVVYYAAEARRLVCNSRLAKLLGYELGEPVAFDLDAFFYQLIVPQTLAVDEICRQLTETQSLDCRIPRRDGDFLVVALSTLELPFAAASDCFLLRVAIRHEDEKMGGALIASNFADYIVNNLQDAIFLAPLSREGVHGNFVDVNRTACLRLGYTREEMLQMNARTLNPDANLLKVKTHGRSIQREGDTLFEAIHVAKDGTKIPVEVNAKVIRIEGVEYVLSTVRDKRQFELHSTMESRFARLVDHSWDEIYIFSSIDYRIVQANQGALNNLGYSSKELMRLKLTDLEPEISETEFERSVQPLFEGSQSQIIYETKHKRKNGSTYPVEIRLQLSSSEEPPVFLANVQDITERKKNENRLQYLANFDYLTGLPNRTLFHDRLAMAMEQCQRNDCLIALLYLDLDGFKRVNDSRGHLVGDDLLKMVAKRLEGLLRRSDTVARLGGDEFCIITGNLKNTQDVEKITSNIIREINKPYTIKDENAYVSTSIGVCFYPFSDDDGSDQILQKADSAMYQAKNKGKNMVCYYEESIGINHLQSFSLEQDLEYALTRSEFYLVYQPRINLIRMEIVGVEALLRWAHPEKGIIPPLDFIHLLENNGKIHAVGAWVLSQACNQLAQWNSNGHRLILSVNVSVKQLENPQFIAIIKQALDESGIEPCTLELELTESDIDRLTNACVSCVRDIKRLGVRISLDDVGSGYSSIGHIRSFTANTLKIDSDVVKDFEHNPDGELIIESLIKLADNLRLNTIAESIETEQQLNLLKSYGCREGQGYYFAKPLTVDELNIKLKALAKKAS